MKFDHEKMKELLTQPFLLGLVGIGVIDSIFLVTDLHKYPEMFLASLVVANAVILLFGVFLSGSYTFILTRGGFELLKETQSKQELELVKQQKELQEQNEKLKKQEQDLIEQQKELTTAGDVLVFGTLNDVIPASTKTSTDVPAPAETPRGILFDTNFAYWEEAIWDMMAESKIAAYGDANHLVNRLNIGDIIFFYHKGYGIVAAGRVTSNPKDGNGKERFCDVEFLTQIPNPEEGIVEYLSPQEIRDITKRNFFFATTIKVPYLRGKENIQPLLDKLIERVGAA